MVAYGAELTLVPYDGQGITRALMGAMIEAARELAARPRTYWANQLANVDSIDGYHAMGEEIWQQMSGRIDAFVHSVGTAASLRGVGTVLKGHDPRIEIVAVGPEESSPLCGGAARTTSRATASDTSRRCGTPAWSTRS
jgi:cysteine synthase A